MKLKRDFILYSKPDKQLPKFKSIDNEIDSVYKKIPDRLFQENPQIKKAFEPEKKPFIMRIKKDTKPELIRINKQMSESDIKIFTKINEMKEIIYDKNNEEDDKEYVNIVKENKLFEKIFKKLKESKKKFKIGNYLDYESFLDISSQYVAKNMKVPNLSSDHNIFSPNPLILQGSELEDYILYNYGNSAKGVKFLKRLDNYLDKRLKGINKMSVKETERIEKIIKEENKKLFIRPQVEIKNLKKDISNSEKTYKNLVGFEEFFKPKKKLFVLSSIKDNNSYYNIYKNSLERSPIKKHTKKILPNFTPEHIYQNSSITPTISIGMTKKYSPKDFNKNKLFNLNSNFKLNIPKVHQFKFPKLNTLIRTTSSLFQNSRNNKNKRNIRIKKINFNNNLSTYNNSLAKKEISSPIFNSNKLFKNHYQKLRILKKMYNLLKYSNTNVYDENKENKDKEYKTILTESEIEEKNKLNKIIKKININKFDANKLEGKKEEEEEEKEKENISKEEIEKNKEISKEKENDAKKNFDFYLLRKVQKSKTKILKTIKKLKINQIREKSKSIFIPKMPNITFNTIKLDPFEEKYKKVENLFDIVKNENKPINLKKETKSKIESFLHLKGKNIKNILTPKSSFYAFQNLKSKSKDSNIIMEEYKIRKKFNIKESLEDKQQIILDKNQGFIKEIIKQEAKINDIIYRDNNGLSLEY